MEPLLIERAIIVAVACEPAQPRVAVEAVAARGVGHEREKVLASQIIDPWQRRARAGDHVFTSVIVEETKLHPKTPPSPKYNLISAESKSFKSSI